MNKNLRTVLLYLVLLVAAVYFVTGTFGATSGRPTELPTSEFLEALEDGRVTNVTFLARDRVVEGEFYPSDDAQQEGEGKRRIEIVRPFSRTRRSG